MTTGKTTALTIRTFVSKMMFLIFNALSRFIIAFLPRIKHLLISWLQSSSSVILESKKIKSLTVSTVSPSICHEMMGPDAMILVLWMLSFLNVEGFTAKEQKETFQAAWTAADLPWGGSFEGCVHFSFYNSLNWMVYSVSVIPQQSFKFHNFKNFTFWKPMAIPCTKT